MWISALGGCGVMPHRQMRSMRKASAVRNTDPTFISLRTLSRTTVTGSFSTFLYSSTPTRCRSSIDFFFMTINLSIIPATKVQIIPYTVIITRLDILEYLVHGLVNHLSITPVNNC